jgi:hypothetical protein
MEWLRNQRYLAFIFPLGPAALRPNARGTLDSPLSLLHL